MAALMYAALVFQVFAKAAPAEELKRLNAEWNSIGRLAMEELQAAQPAERRALKLRIVQRYQVESQAFAQRFMRLAGEYLDDPIAIDALLWVADNCNGSPIANDAATRLVEDHINEAQVVSHIKKLGRWLYPTDEFLLRALVESTTDPETKTVCQFRLGKTLALQSTWARQLDADSTGTLSTSLNERPLGPSILKHLQAANASRLETEAKTLLRTLTKEASHHQLDGKPLADLAEAELVELKELGVGCNAPDVVGEDIDGASLKLADYRGQVVVLSFWGHW